jgi:hypothetical protein
MMTRYLSVAFGMSLLTASAKAQDFQPGDMWLVSQGVYNGVNFPPGIARIDTVTATANLVVPNFLSPYLAVSTFDTFRNAIVIAANNAATTQLHVVHADGSMATLGADAANLRGVAATGDGRVYYFRAFGAPAPLEYIDAANVVHNLLDASGSAPFDTGLASVIVQAMYYDSNTNSLHIGIQVSGTPCGVAYQTAGVMVIPLSPDGTKVGGTVQSVPLCTFPMSPLRVVNLSQGPGNTVMAVLDDNSNSAVGRMVTINTATLGVSTYAANGPYTGAAATVAGVYSHLLGRAVINDGFAVTLRVYANGETGNGTTWVNGGVSVHANASMVEIPNSAATGLLPFGTGTPGCKGTQALFATCTPKVGTPNFRFTCTNVPNSALGLLLIGDVPDVNGSDPFNFGAKFHVDIFASSSLTPMDLYSTPLGLGGSAAPIPINPAIVGLTFDCMALWVWSGCSTPSPLGISSSMGLAVTIQP